MDKTSFTNLKHAFCDYVSTFRDRENKLPPELQKKLEHIIKVADNCAYIAEKSGYNENDILLAKICGIYHDIGRFPQFSEYSTFNDSVSVNHGLHGFKTMVLRNMLGSIPSEEATIILNSVRFHNSRILPAELSGQSLVFTKIVRDADKLDIINDVNEAIATKAIDTDKATVWNLEFGELSKPVFDAIAHHKSANYDDVKNATDVCLLQLSWAFDMNFKASLKRITELKAIENVNSLVSKKSLAAQAAEMLRLYVKNTLES